MKPRIITGIYDSFQDYADNFADEILGDGINAYASRYFDYEQHARDLERLHGFRFTKLSAAVFTNS